MSRKLLPWLTTILSASLIAFAALPAGALGPVSTAPSHPAGRAAQHAAAQKGYGQAPLAFEANEGQTSGAVRYLAHGNGYTLFLTPGAAVLSLRQGAAPARGQMDMGASARLGSATPASPATETLGMRWLGANSNPVVTGEEPLPGTVNYFIGNNPTQWHTHIPTYQQVRYHEVYPGVDLVYYGSQGGQLEYDFVVAPGADPAAIQLGFTGAQRLGVDLLGNLSLTLPGGALRQNHPAIYQTVNGARRMVAGSFALTATGQVGFALGTYDPHLPLVIDPSYKFSTYLGGSDGDNANSIAVDSAGDAYVAGNTYSTNFPTDNPVQNVNAGSSDVFIAKFNAAGTALIYSTYLGGSATDYESGLALDSMGDAYVFGSTGSTNFPVLNAYESTPHDLFVTKLTANGAGLFYSTYFGGSGPDYANGIAVDSSGDAYLSGATASSDFPTLHPVQASNAGSYDAYVSELNASGNGLVYSTYLGGSANEEAYSIAVDASGAAYVTGVTTSLNFPTTLGVVQPHMATSGVQNAFIAKLNPTGSPLVYSTYLGGDNGAIAPHQPTPTSGRLTPRTIFSSCNCSEYAQGIAVDASGDAYITGQSNSPNFPTTPGAFQTSAPAGTHVFVSKLNPTASALDYSTFVAGSGTEYGQAITVDFAGNAYITGYTFSPNFPTVNPLQGTLGNTTFGDAYVTKLNSSGSALLYSSFLDGSTNYGSIGFGIALNLGRDVYVAGVTSATNFPTKNAFQNAFAGGNGDAFVTKMRLWPSADTTTGVFRPSNGALYLKNANTTGPADIALYYGQPGDQPVTGDWTGKGYKSIGIYRAGTFYLRNSNTTGVADIVAAFGASGDIPVAGDWTGKGYDSIGVYRPSTSTFYLRNSNTSGPPDIAVTLGISGDVPIVGDWTGKGYDSVGVFRPSNGIVYLRNSNTTGFADSNFVYGIAGDKPVVGDWTAQGADTIGVDRNGEFLLRNSNTTGPADLSFYLGVAGDDPIAGPWLAPPGSSASHGAPAPARVPATTRTPSGAVDRPRHAA